jgi:hypothetical protein
MFSNIVALAAIAVLVVVIVDFMHSYMKSTETGWQRIWDAGRGSATIVIQQLGMVAAATVAMFNQVTDWVCSLLSTPESADAIKSAIGSYVTGPNVGIALAIFVSLTVAARMRSLGK